MDLISDDEVLEISVEGWGKNKKLNEDHLDPPILIFLSKETNDPSQSYNAEGLYWGQGVVEVLKGSQAVATAKDYVANCIQEDRDNLLDDNHKIKEDHKFKNPSRAAGVIQGASENGWTAWKTEDGITLDELTRRSKS